MNSRRWCRVALVVVATAAAVACERGEPEERAAGRERQARTRIDPAIADSLPPGVTLAMVEQGQELYATTCLACHGPAGEGTQLGPRVDGAAVAVEGEGAADAGEVEGGEAAEAAEGAPIAGSIEAIAEVIRAGTAEPDEFPVPMPAFGAELAPEQVRALAAYVYAMRFGAR